MMLTAQQTLAHARAKLPDHIRAQVLRSDDVKGEYRLQLSCTDPMWYGVIVTRADTRRAVRFNRYEIDMLIERYLGEMPV